MLSDCFSPGGFFHPSPECLAISGGSLGDQNWGRESSCHCVSVGNNSRDYECLPLSGNSCRQSTVNHRPYGTDHTYCRSSAGEMSPLIGGGREGLIKTSVRQILKDWISDIVVLFVYLLMYYRSLPTKVEALWGQKS